MIDRLEISVQQTLTKDFIYLKFSIILDLLGIDQLVDLDLIFLSQSWLLGIQRPFMLDLCT